MDFSKTEKKILGSCFSYEKCMDQAMDNLRKKHFHYYAPVFECLQEFYGKGRDHEDCMFDVKQMLDDRGSKVDVYSFINHAKPSINETIETLKAEWLRREANGVSVMIQDQVQEGEPEEVVMSAIHRLSELITDENKDQQHIADVMNDTVMLIDRLRSGEKLGFTTGLDIDKVLQGFQKGMMYLLAARPSMGKAQPLSEPVHTPGGWVEMRALEVGDKISSIGQQQSFIEGIYPQGQKKVYKIEFSDGRTTRATGDHLWQVYNRKWKEDKIITTSELMEYLEKPSYKNRLSIPTPTIYHGKRYDSEFNPWIIGFLIANGCLTKGTMFSTGSAFCLDRMRTLLPNCFTINKCNEYDYRIVEYESNGNMLLDYLRELGLDEKRAEQKFIPNRFKNLDYDGRMQLLRGLMDGDGWAEKSGSIRYSTSSKQLADDMVDLCRSFGALCEHKEKEPSFTYKGKKKNGQTHYTVKIRHLNPKRFFTHPEKKEKANNSRIPRLTIKDITEDGVEQCQCIKVSADNSLYISGEYVVTHNTALAIQIAKIIAQKVPVGFLSLETTNKSLGLRYVVNHSGIAGDKVRKGHLTEQEYSKILNSAGELSELDIVFDDTSNISAQGLRSKINKMKRKYDVEFVIVDYMQLMDGEGNTREQQVADISKASRAVAKEFDVCLLGLAQLSRSNEKRGGDKRPILSDLRESGQLEQDAFSVIFLHRPEYYGIEKYPNGDSTRGIAELIIAKHKDGPTGMKKMLFKQRTMRFENLIKEPETAPF